MHLHFFLGTNIKYIMLLIGIVTLAPRVKGAYVFESKKVV